MTNNAYKKSILDKKAWKTSLLLIFLISIGFYLRFKGIDRTIWADESCTVSPVEMNYTDFWNHFRTSDTHPPLYFLGAKLSVSFSKILSNNHISLSAIRVFSVIGSIFVFAGIFLCSRTITERPVLFSLMLTAFSPLLILHAHEARAYSWLAAGFALLPWLINGFATSKNFQQKIFQYSLSLLLTILVLTHYYGIFAVISVFSTIFVLYSDQELKQRFKTSLLPVFPALLFLGIWLALTTYARIEQIFSHSGYHFGKPSTGLFISKMFEGISGWLYWSADSIPMCFTILSTLLIINGSIMIFKQYKRIGNPILLAVLTTFYISLSLVIATALTAEAGDLNLLRPRYFSIIIPSALIIVAFRLHNAGYIYRFIAGTIVAFLMIWSFSFIHDCYFSHDHQLIDSKINESQLPVVAIPRALYQYSISRTSTGHPNKLLCYDIPLTVQNKSDHSSLDGNISFIEDFKKQKHRSFWYIFENLSPEAVKMDRKFRSYCEEKYNLMEEIYMPSGVSRRISLYLPLNKITKAKVDLEISLDVSRWIFPTLYDPLVLWSDTRAYDMKQSGNHIWSVELPKPEINNIYEKIRQYKLPGVTSGSDSAFVSSLKYSVKKSENGNVAISINHKASWTEQPVVRNITEKAAYLLAVMELVYLIGFIRLYRI